MEFFGQHPCAREVRHLLRCVQAAEAGLRMLGLKVQNLGVLRWFRVSFRVYNLESWGLGWFIGLRIQGSLGEEASTRALRPFKRSLEEFFQKLHTGSPRRPKLMRIELLSAVIYMVYLQQT